MGDQFPLYTCAKRSTLYFSRRIPKDIQEHFNTPRNMCWLKTKTLFKASRLAQRLNENLEDEWWQIRRHNAENTLLRFLNEHAGPIVPSAFPSLSECRGIYLEQKGTGKNKTFFQPTDKAINTVIQLSGDRPADRCSMHYALTLWNHLKAHSLNVANSKRVSSMVRSVMNFASTENGLELSNPFSKVFLGENLQGSIRHPIPLKEIRNIQYVTPRFGLIDGAGIKTSPEPFLKSCAVFA